MLCKIEGASSLLCDKKHRRKVLPIYINDLVKLYTEYGSSTPVIVTKIVLKGLFDGFNKNGICLQ